jgi:VanZ family protein
MARRALPAWTWTVLLLALCLLPRYMTPEARPSALAVAHLDKLVHAVLFFAFGLLWTRAVAPARQARTIFVAGVLLAVGTELAQGSSLVDRDPDVLDALADVVGLVVGIASYRLAPRLSAA